MIGTLVNAASIIAGGAIGLALKRIMPKRIAAPVMRAEGVGVIVISLMGILETAATNGSELEFGGQLMLLACLVAGCLAGELLKIDDRINGAAERVEKRMGKSGFAAGFVNAALIYCVGALTIIGPMREVLTGDRQLLLVKSFLDGITSIMLGATLGYGVLFSAAPVLLLQGGCALFASALSGVPQWALNNLFLVGYAIVGVIGINFLFGERLKTANLLPAILFALLYNLIAGL